MSNPRIVLALAPLILAAGCSSNDERLVALSRESLARQAEQNQAMARQSQEIAQAARLLVEADAKARGDVIQLQTDLEKSAQAMRTSLDRQHEDLENERRQLASQRQRDPIIAAAILDAGMILACLLPLVLAWYVLRNLQQEPADAALGELLVQELVADEPLLLPSPLCRPAPLELEHDPSLLESSATSQSS